MFDRLYFDSSVLVEAYRYVDGEYTNIAFEAVRLRGSGGLGDLMFAYDRARKNHAA